MSSNDSAPAPPTSARGPTPDAQDFSRHPETPLFTLLDSLALPYANIAHEPTHTVAESRAIKTDMKGGHTKTLFMKDKKQNLVLISAWHDSQLALNQLHKLLGTQRLSFTSADLLWDVLGVTPGSVTAFALMNDHQARVRFILDAALSPFDTINFHPLRNDMTTSISRTDFATFVAATGHQMEIVDFSTLGATPDDH